MPILLCHKNEKSMYCEASRSVISGIAFYDMLRPMLLRAAVFVFAYLLAPCVAAETPSAHSYYPVPSGSVNRYAATHVFVGRPNQVFIGITTGAAAVIASVATDAMFSSNMAPLAFSSMSGDIVFTANPSGGVEDFQSKSALIADLNAAGKQVFYSDLCEWKVKDAGCDNGTILELAFPGPKGAPVVSYGSCMNYETASHILCCKVTVPGKPFRKPGTPKTRLETRLIPCPDNSYTPSAGIGVTQQRTYTCSPSGPVPGPWVIVATNCVNYCVAPPPEFATEECASGYIGAKVKIRSYTCPGPTAGAWDKLIDSCEPEPKWDDCVVPPPETKNISCASAGVTTPVTGYSAHVTAGVITYQRTWKCVQNSPVAGDWQEISRNCRQACLHSGYVGPGRFAPWGECCSNSTWINWLCFNCPVCN